MTIGEKIRSLMEAKRIASIDALHATIKAVFPDKPLSRRGLYHILQNDVKLREQHIFQLTTIFDIPRNDFIKGTNLEEKLKTKGPYLPVSDKAAYILISGKPPSAILQLVIKPHGRTPEEQDPGYAKLARKDITVMSGTLTVTIKRIGNDERVTLKKGSVYSFDSRELHCFENMSSTVVKAIINHFPLEHSIFTQTEYK